MNRSVQELLTTPTLFALAEHEIRHVVSFSGGKGSWAAGKDVASWVPHDQLTLLFSDTIIEDQDTYRLVIEGAANIYALSRPSGLIDRALSLPELSLTDPHCLERKLLLMEMRADAMAAIPGLVWIADGRHPWEVYEDRRFIGNSHFDPCSLVLKRELINAWRNANCRPDSTVSYVGIDWTERHRLDRMLPLVHQFGDAPLGDCVSSDAGEDGRFADRQSAQQA